MLLCFRSRPALRIGALVALLPLGLAACGGEAATETWVGRVSDSDVVVAVVRGESSVRAYMCGGPTSFATRSRWFNGSADESGAFEATADGWTFASELGEEEASGTLTPAIGEVLSFSAVAVEADGTAGLYGAQSYGCRTGVVVGLESSGEPWLQGTWCNDQGQFEQVTPVLPIERGDLGIHVAVDLTDIGRGKLDLHALPVLVR